MVLSVFKKRIEIDRITTIVHSLGWEVTKQGMEGDTVIIEIQKEISEEKKEPRCIEWENNKA